MEIGYLERELMEMLWTGGKADAREVYEAVRKKRKTTYSTINTTLVRLFQKGLLEREKIRSRGGFKYVYSPARSRKEFEEKRVKEILFSLFEKFEHATVNYLSETLDEEEAEIRELKKRLEEEMKRD
ncbi:MAG: BlaI/MecI/CopY family transcriptional regulator [Theionarchaea archaeon]|nr:BlaI/MecI/CopY family transcriptional regulator [Theionarchaea archaeon]MBU7021300.1 BlaI/MecI/CopY family transcriptional regulator [Theionarchaea archaeon]MBU7035884.1 BlaI/MecI/CopY family transcriptional regulator [Theionarchaea archaeon]MBU7040838.1 BlaI/MecI/CopY family transcriptional regulator [Theionarchaea archaeon]